MHYTKMADIVPIIVGKDDVEKLLNTQDLLTNLESALGRLSDGKDGGVEQPIRSVVSVEKYHGFLATMPGYSAMDNALATKLVSFYPNNTSLPTHQAWVMLFDPSNGSLQALIDGVSITAIRTGVASAVATKHLANPNAKILAIIGSGVQARSHLQALSVVQHFDEVRVWSRNPENVQKFAKDMKESADLAGSVLKTCSTAKEAVEGADVICVVSFATTPVILNDWVKPGAHINAVGACRPDWQELDSNLMRSSVVYCDSREACLREAGDIIISGCDVYAEIGEVINGRKEALWEKTTIFKSVGLAIEDVISAKLVYDKIVQKQSEVSSSVFSPSVASNVSSGTTPFFSNSLAGSSLSPL